MRGGAEILVKSAGVLRGLAGAAVILVLLAACREAVRLSYADWMASQETREGMEHAAAVAPENAWPHLALALLLAEADPRRSEAELAEAVRRDPWDSRSLIELGLRAEVAGDFTRAERLLLAAAGVDALYVPRWTLANYYFRRGDEGKFWTWARRAVVMAPADMTPLFRLAADVGGPSGDVASLLRLDRPEQWNGYLGFAMANGRAREVAEAAGILSRFRRREDRPAILAGCDFLTRSGHVDEALEVWRAAGRNGLIPYSADEARAGRVTNPEFQETPLGAGFDWRIPAQGGVEAARLESPAALRIRMTGQQEERCELLWQYIPVRGPAELILSVSFRTEDLPRDSGLRWMMFDAVSGAVAGREEDWLSRDDWGEEQIRFRVPGGTNAVRLSLVYERAPGTVRAQGDIALRSVQLSVAVAGGLAVPNEKEHANQKDQQAKPVNEQLAEEPAAFRPAGYVGGSGARAGGPQTGAVHDQEALPTSVTAIGDASNQAEDTLLESLAVGAVRAVTFAFRADHIVLYQMLDGAVR